MRSPQPNRRADRDDRPAPGAGRALWRNLRHRLRVAAVVPESHDVVGGSASLRALKPGTRVFAEGPYGAFTTLHRTRPNTLLLAGGVGITPIRALLEELRGHVVVIYRVSRPQDAVLHVVTGPSHHSPLGPHALARAVPDIRDRDVFVCGPPGMTGAVLRSLCALGVPKPQVHAERFSLAS